MEHWDYQVLTECQAKKANKVISETVACQEEEVQ